MLRHNGLLGDLLWMLCIAVGGKAAKWQSGRIWVRRRLQWLGQELCSWSQWHGREWIWGFRRRLRQRWGLSVIPRSTPDNPRSSPGHPHHPSQPWRFIKAVSVFNGLISLSRVILMADMITNNQLLGIFYLRTKPRSVTC